MKKQFIIVGITILLLVVGMSGCEEISDSPSDITSIEEVHMHPNRYLENEVTVKGLWHKSESPYYNGTVIENGFVLYLNLNSDETILIDGGEYIFTGNLTIEEIYYQDSLIINVTNIHW